MQSDVVRLFDTMAEDYDALEPWYQHLYHALHAILCERLVPPAGGGPWRALDAGCGTGFQTALLQGLGYATHGVDLAPKLLAIARRDLPAVVLARASIEALPYPDGGFDAIACCGSTLSFVDSPRRAIAEMGRVLRPGGLLLLECDHAWSLDLAWALLGALARDALGYGVTAAEAWRCLARRPAVGCVVRYPGYGTLRLFTVRELRAMLREAGLAVERLWGIHMLTNIIPSTVLHRPRISRAVGALFRALGAADAALRRVPGAHHFANNVVVLGRKTAGRGLPGAAACARRALAPRPEAVGR